MLRPNPPHMKRVFPRYELTWSVSGTPPIYTVLSRNSTVLLNTTKTQGHFILDEEGNYSCVATSKYGSDAETFTVTFFGKTLV